MTSPNKIHQPANKAKASNPQSNKQYHHQTLKSPKKQANTNVNNNNTKQHSQIKTNNPNSVNANI